MNVKKIKIFAIIGMFGMLLVIVVFFVVKKTQITHKLLDQIYVDSSATISVKNIKQLYTKQGKNELLIIAKQAKYYNNDNKVELFDLETTFFTKDNQKVILNCNNAVLDTKDKNMDAKGNVKITFGDKYFTSESLYYNGVTKKINSNEVPVLYGEKFKISAKKLEVDLETQTLKMENNVQAYFNN